MHTCIHTYMHTYIHTKEIKRKIKATMPYHDGMDTEYMKIILNKYHKDFEFCS